MNDPLTLVPGLRVSALILAALLGITPGLGLLAADFPVEVAVLSRSAPSNPAWEQLDGSGLNLQSGAVMVVDTAGNTIYAKRADEAKSIASVTKLMTAMVVLDAGVDLDAPIIIRPEDKDSLALRRSSIQVVELHEQDGRLTCDRDAPTYVQLAP